MEYCDTGKNFTMSLIEIKIGNFLTIKGNRMGGSVGLILNKYYGLNRKNINYCKFVPVNEFGDKLANGSFTGAAGLMQKGHIDSYWRAQPINLNQPFMKMSGVIFQDGFYLGQFLTKKVVDSTKGDSLKMFDIDIWMKILPFLAFIFIFCILFKLITNLSPIRKVDLIIENLFEINYHFSRSMNIISVIILFYLIYLMIFKSILVNNIKTNSVIVNTSEVINTKDLLKTNKRICYWSGEFGIKFISQAPKGSFLDRLFMKSKESHNFCQLNQLSDPRLYTQFSKSGNFDDFLLLLNEIYLIGMRRFFSEFAGDQFFFRSENAVFKINDVVFFKKDVDPYFLKITDARFEVGLVEKLSDETKMVLTKSLMYKNRAFASKKEYIEEFRNLNNDVSYHKLKDTLFLYLIANSISFSLFVIIKLFEYLITLIIKIEKRCNDEMSL